MQFRDCILREGEKTPFGRKACLMRYGLRLTARGRCVPGLSIVAV
jgi:hypothetical protein